VRGRLLSPGVLFPGAAHPSAVPAARLGVASERDVRRAPAPAGSSGPGPVSAGASP